MHSDKRSCLTSDRAPGDSRAPASVIERRTVAWKKDDEVGQAHSAITGSQSRKTLSRTRLKGRAVQRMQS
jgi:hypothetical protein